MRSTPHTVGSLMAKGRGLLHPAPLILLAAFLVPPPHADNKSLLGLPPLCPLKALTGIPCPGCGISRSLVCCGHGELGRAMALHPLGPIVFALLIGTTVLRFFPQVKLPQKGITVGAVLLLIAALTLWLLRLLGWLPKPP